MSHMMNEALVCLWREFVGPTFCVIKKVYKEYKKNQQTGQGTKARSN
jgi:hypothetical protein